MHRHVSNVSVVNYFFYQNTQIFSQNVSKIVIRILEILKSVLQLLYHLGQKLNQKEIMGIRDLEHILGQMYGEERNSKKYTLISSGGTQLITEYQKMEGWRQYFLVLSATRKYILIFVIFVNLFTSNNMFRSRRRHPQ